MRTVGKTLAVLVTLLTVMFGCTALVVGGVTNTPENYITPVGVAPQDPPVVP